MILLYGCIVWLFVCLVIYYDNWVECNSVWNHTCDFKSEWVCRVGLTWNYKYDLRPKLHSPKFNNYHFVTSIFIFNGNVKQSFGNKSCKIPHTIPFFSFHFPAISSATFSKPWNLTGTGCFVLVFLSHWLGKRCDLEQKIVWFVNYCTAEGQSHSKDHQWFQTECNNFFFRIH